TRFSRDWSSDVCSSDLDVKSLFLNSNQTFIPIVNEEKNILGIIYFKKVRGILFNHYKLHATDIASVMQATHSVSLSENTGNVIELMDKEKIGEVLVTQHQQLIGYVAKVRILGEYRENLQQLRIE